VTLVGKVINRVPNGVILETSDQAQVSDGLFVLVSSCLVCWSVFNFFFCGFESRH